MSKDWVRDAARLPGTQFNRCPSLLLPLFGSFSSLRGQVVYLRNVRRKAQDRLPLGALPSQHARLLPVFSVSGSPSPQGSSPFPELSRPQCYLPRGMERGWTEDWSCPPSVQMELLRSGTCSGSHKRAPHADSAA